VRRRSNPDKKSTEHAAEDGIISKYSNYAPQGYLILTKNKLTGKLRKMFLMEDMVLCAPTSLADFLVARQKHEDPLDTLAMNDSYPL
jgi:hypothetical protein